MTVSDLEATSSGEAERTFWSSHRIRSAAKVVVLLTERGGRDYDVVEQQVEGDFKTRVEGG